MNFSYFKLCEKASKLLSHVIEKFREQERSFAKALMFFDKNQLNKKHYPLR